MRGGGSDGDVDAPTLSDFDRRLTIRGVRPSDSGHYACTAHYESRVDAAAGSGDPTTTHAHQTTVTVELRVGGGKRQP